MLLVIAALAGALLVARGPEQEGKMFPQQPNDEQRLAAYMATDPKLAVAPVPTPIDRGVASRFIVQQIPRAGKPADLRKLAAVAIVYDLRDAVQAFGGILRRTEKEPREAAKSAQALIALAWLGESQVWDFAQRYFHDLQDRFRPDDTREDMLEVCFALGPREGTGYHRQWVTTRLARVKEEAAKAAEPDATKLNRRAANLQHHASLVVARTDRALAARARVESMPPEARIAPLAGVYLDEPGLVGITDDLSWWAGVTLIRLAVSGLRAQIGAEFTRLAAKYDNKQAGEQQGEFDLLRARALRAMEFFGQQPNEAAKKWLASQKDSGADLLALRPNWQYAGSPKAAEAR